MSIIIIICCVPVFHVLEFNYVAMSMSEFVLHSLAATEHHHFQFCTNISLDKVPNSLELEDGGSLHSATESKIFQLQTPSLAK